MTSPSLSSPPAVPPASLPKNVDGTPSDDTAAPHVPLGGERVAPLGVVGLRLARARRQLLVVLPCHTIPCDGVGVGVVVVDEDTDTDADKDKDGLSG